MLIKSMISKLKALGVRDSKELTDPQIIQLSHVIKELIPYKLLIVEPKNTMRSNQTTMLYT